MKSDGPAPDKVERLRAERDEWRRRAEVAEAVAAERLFRAETAERALAGAEAALANLGQAAGPTRKPASAKAGARTAGDAADGALDSEPAAPPPRPRSLLERWRRYTDTIN